MSDAVLRHLVAFLATFFGGIIFLAGYGAGGRGWWWAVLPLLILYPIIFGIINND